MRIYYLKWLHHKGQLDVMIDCVVIAKSPMTARAIACDSAQDEGRAAWLSGVGSTCDCIGVAGKREKSARLVCHQARGF